MFQLLLLVCISFFTPAAKAATTNYQIAVVSVNFGAPYNYCIGVQNALVDVTVLNEDNGAQVGFFGLVSLSDIKPAKLAFSGPDGVAIRVLVTPRQSEYGVGLPTDTVSCDPNHRVDVPLVIAGGLMRIDPDGFVRSTSIGKANYAYSGVSTDVPGQSTEIPALALVYDAACESDVACMGNKISAVAGRGYVTAAGATDTSGIVPRHGVIADGISTLIIKFPASAGPIALESIDDQGGPFLGSASTPFLPYPTSPVISVTSLLPCPLGQLYLIGSQTGQCAPFNTSSVVPSLQNTFAYQAPADFPDETVASRGNIALVGPVGEIRGVNLFFDTTTAVGQQTRTWFISIDLARPPVILIHGLWSTSSTWSNFVANANSDGNYDLLRRLSLALPNYAFGLFGASDTFSPLSKPVSVGIVELAINDGALAAERAAGFAASAVDAVGHSMGGLQVRSLAAGGGRLNYVRADNYFAGSIHKLVTIGTPHFGAPIARELMKNRCASSALLQSMSTYNYGPEFGDGFSFTPPQPITTFEHYFDLLGYNYYFGPALQDLQPGSDALTALNATSIPTHVIGSTAPNAKFAFSLAEYAASAIFGINIDTSAALGPAGDGVVPLSSQLSGFASSDTAATVLTGLYHVVQETGDVQSYNAIDLSLRSGTFPPQSLGGSFAAQLPATTSDGGTNYSFATCPPISATGSAVKSSRTSTRSLKATGSTPTPVLTPANGTVVSPGQSVVVSAQLQGTTTAEFVFENLVIAGTGGFGSFSTTLQIPQGVLGRIPFSAILNDGQGNLTRLNSYLVVSADLTGATIAATPQSIVLGHVGDSAQVLAIAKLPNGTVLSFDSSVTGVTYNLTSSGTSRNAILTGGSTVLATRKGQGSLSIAAAGSTVTVPVTVSSNGFVNQATSSLAIVYKNIADPRTAIFTVSLPGDLLGSDINLTQIALAGDSAAVPVTWGSVAPTDRQLTFQASAKAIATAFPIGATSLSLIGLTQDGTVWTSTTSVQVSSNGAIVPDLVGDTQTTASPTLASSGLSVGTVSQVNSASANIGVVLSEGPQAGSVVDASTPINLTTSSGVVVPNAVSITQAMASAAITSAGLTVGTVTQQSSSSVPSGSVISQSPVAGTNVNPASSVNLTVSSGPPPAGKGGGGALDGWVLFILLGLALTQRWRFVPDQR
jgi:pimeloyl-ACP methyl ester carboxylesterase